MRKGRGIKVRRKGRKQEKNSSDREQGIDRGQAGRKKDIKTAVGREGGVQKGGSCAPSSRNKYIGSLFRS